MADDGALAPVIPLFGGAAAATPADGGAAGSKADNPAVSGSWHTTWTRPAVGLAASPGASDSDDDGDDDATAAADAGEAALLRKLRTRSLSVREARAVLVEHDVAEVSVETIVDRFLSRGYLDDLALAEQLMHSAVERKGQGRMVVSQTLAKRGIPREVIDAALAELPDDERERALTFARTKARAMRGLEREVALRRLSAQLVRRGYGSYALEAARTALDSPSRIETGRPARGVVRFES